MFLSLAMSLIGIGGVIGAYGLLTIPPSELEPVELVPGTADATSAMFTAMAADPVMKGIQVGNLLASGLLVVASMLLTIRRPSAIWWSRQALLANLIYTLAYAAANVWFARLHPALIDAMFAQGGQPPPEGAPTLVMFSIGTSCGTLIMLAIYGVMIRIVGRQDVRSFVTREAS